MEQSYKEKYEHALAKAKEQYNYPCMRSCMGILEEIFPELAESEDERIRKAIVNAIHNYAYRLEEKIPTEWIVWLEKQGEQKPIWHNEDEEPQRGSLILLIMQGGNPIVAKIIEPNHTFNHGERWAYIDDLLEKQGEQKPAWSEKDEDKVKFFMQLIEGCDNCEELSNWLKSLRPQNTWKPSDEQIDLLQAIINEPNNAVSESCQIVLKDILEQLKKLKKEQA